MEEAGLMKAFATTPKAEEMRAYRRRLVARMHRAGGAATGQRVIPVCPSENRRDPRAVASDLGRWYRKLPPIPGAIERCSVIIERHAGAPR